VVLVPDGWSGGVDWAAVAIASAVWWLLERTKVELHWALVAAALAGLAVQASGWT
jgi:hypothetical protein